ncbi:hypothetical protein ACIGNX_00245 [Actinosynnema sp. NPDC053489]|uniref:hypothetical protein n=1 Tax=Actinosynnema sp. NPDC053489 TaxID=3363916 RepID=UPI0037C5771E
MPVLRKVVTTGVAMAAGLPVVAGTGSAAPAGADEDRLNAARTVRNHPTKKALKDVWKTTPAYSIKGDGTKTSRGTLTAGPKRYFHCQKNRGQGYRETVWDSGGGGTRTRGGR